MRVISSTFFSAASFYLLAILATALSNLANPEGVWGGGSTLLPVPSLFAVMFYLGPLWATLVAVPSGAAIGLSWNWTTRSIRNLFLTSAFIASGFLALIVAEMFWVQEHSPQYHEIEWVSIGEILVIVFIIFAANAIGITLTKRFYSASSDP